LKRLQAIPAKVTARKVSGTHAIDRSWLPNKRHKRTSRHLVVTEWPRLSRISAFLAVMSIRQWQIGGKINFLARRLQLVVIVENVAPLAEDGGQMDNGAGD
jgi:hypothetical protein